MEIVEIKSEKLNDKYYKIKHTSGLTIYVSPKEGYKSAYAIFGTHFGSVNSHFITNGEEVIVPDGIAHYLEHKLFESEDGDAFTKYAKTGANANAYTSFNTTCYLFSCTDNFDESLRILLDFVRDPYFTKETVAKEQGIIGQEIKMYDDSPDWRVMMNLISSMFQNHPVRKDIAGTVETIAEITPELLYTCYNSYYNLNNMVLSVAGNVTPEQVIAIVDEILTKQDEPLDTQSIFPDEPYEVGQDYVEQKLSVAVPLFQLGFKEDAGDKRLTSKEIAETDILLSAFAGEASPLYKRLLDDELINQSFGYEYFEEMGYRAVILQQKLVFLREFLRLSSKLPRSFIKVVSRKRNLRELKELFMVKILLLLIVLRILQLLWHHLILRAENFMNIWMPSQMQVLMILTKDLSHSLTQITQHFQ